MRGLVALYSVVCEEEGTTSNSELLKVFRKMDMIEEDAVDAGRTADTIASAPSDADTAAARARARDFTAAAYPSTLAIGSPANYLGDAGTAAVFRMLPYMRWVRAVEARAVGAGPRAIAALCAALYLTQRVTVELNETEGDRGESATDAPLSPSPARTVTVVVPAIPLERVDLSSNAIYAMSARQLLAAVRRRAELAARAAAVLAELPAAAAARVQVPAPPAILLDFDAIPETMAAQLRAYHRVADDSQQREAEEAARARTMALRRSLFCESAAAAGAGSMIYRIPTVYPPLPRKGSDTVDGEGEGSEEQARPATAPLAFYDHSNASAAAVAAEVNTHMEAYLFAHRCFTARDRLRHRRERQKTEPGMEGGECTSTAAAYSRAAAQLAVDVGGDVLRSLPDTLAVVWLTLDLAHADGGEEEKAGAPTAEQREGLLFSIGRLLRSLVRNPCLEDELLAHARAVSGSDDVLRRYLYRLRELYYCLTAGTGAGTREELLELRGLYVRLVSALVTGPFRPDRLPSMQAAEHAITAVRTYLVDYMLDGTPLPAASPIRVDGEVPLQEARRAWPLLCAAAKYFRRNHAALGDGWNAQYLGAEAPVADARDGVERREESTAAEVAADADERAFFLQPLSSCHCATALPPHRRAAVEGESEAVAGGLPAPCPACCHDALRAMHDILGDTYMHQREALMAPLRLYLPRDVRLFLLEWVLLQQPAGEVGIGMGYVPALCGCPSSLEVLTSAHEGGRAAVTSTSTTTTTSGTTAASGPVLVSPVDIFAYLDGDRQRLGEFCDCFAEWYRLKAIERYDCAQTTSCTSP